MTSVAYAGTRVIEIASTLSAGVAGRCFADLGADVVRVEEVEHLPLDPAERAVQTWARARKRVLAPRTRGEVGVGDIDALLAGADVVITDLSPSRWDETFPPLEALVDAYPGLVLVDVTRFGRVGPYVDYLAPDLVVLALSGYLFMCGLNDREPLRLGVDLVDVMTGINAAGGAMLGLHHARGTGQGQVVEVSALRTMLCSTMSFAATYSYQGMVRRRSSTRMVSVGIMLPCKDGHALVNTFRTPSDILFVLLGDERLLDEKFADAIGREEHQQEMAEIMIEAAASRTMGQLFEAGQELRLQNAMVQSPLQTPGDPQHTFRRFFQPLTLEDGTTIPAPVPPLVPVEARDDRAHRARRNDRGSRLGHLA